MMEKEPLLGEEVEEKLPEAEAFHVWGREEAVICPICGHQEHAPKVGEPGGVQECEFCAAQGVHKEYEVKKAA